MKRLSSVKSSLAVIAAAAMLTACGDGTSTLKTSSEDLVIQMTTSNGPALASSLIQAGAYTFGNGVPGFGTTSSTTVAVTGTAQSPTFSIGNTGSTATGNFSFGSCIFSVTSVTPDPGTLQASLALKDEDGTLGLPYKITINPCTLTINTSGSTANGSTQSVVTYLDLDNTDGSYPSAPIPVSISPSGIVLDSTGTKIGDVEVLTATGGTGASN